jgi:hypothetical protein
VSIELPLDNLRVRGFSTEDFTDEDLIDGWFLIWEIINLLTNRNYEPADLTLKLDGIGTDEIYIPTEIISIASVSEETLGTLVADTDYVVYNRQVPDDREYPRIVLLNGTFPKGNQNITIVGRFGYIDPKSGTREQPPLPLIEVAKRLLPVAFENILAGGDRELEIAGSRRGIQREKTDRWSYSRFNRGGIENQLLDDSLMNAILLKYYKGSDIISVGVV